MKKETEELLMQEDAVEKIFCEFLADKAKVPMTSEDSEMFIRMTMSPSIPLPTDEKEFGELPFQVQVIAKRFEYLNLKVDMSTALFFAMLCKSVGDLVIYATMITYLAKKKGISQSELVRKAVQQYLSKSREEEYPRAEIRILPGGSQRSKALLCAMITPEKIFSKTWGIMQTMREDNKFSLYKETAYLISQSFKTFIKDME